MTDYCCKKCADYDNDSGRICANPACRCHKSAEKECPCEQAGEKCCGLHDHVTTDTAENKCTCPTFSIGEKVLHKSDCALRGFAADTRCRHGVHGTDCSKCFHTDTSDWRERFDRELKFHVAAGTNPSLVISFIEKEKELSREEGRQSMYEEIYTKDIVAEITQAEQSRILKLVESQMLNKIYYIGDDLPQVAQDKRPKFVLLGTPKEFLDTLISKIKNV